MIPQKVLGILANKSSEKSYKFRRLYRNLYNEDFFLLAYSNIYAKEGNMTEGTDGNTIDGISMKKIRKTIESLKDESYQPNPARRMYIDKKNSTKKRPLGIPSFMDKLVQEILRMMFEAMYDGTFSDRSHGFRPNRSCHTALVQIKTNFTGVKWWVEGDIKGFFDNINHQVLIEFLKKRIDDEKFMRLIWKFLKAGYIEDWTYHNTFSGTPQGGIISPILSNIYLNELDVYMDEFKAKFDKGKTRKRNLVYNRLMDKIIYKKAVLEKKKDSLSKDEFKAKLVEIKKLENEMLSLPSKDPFDSEYRRIQYVRYADDFLIGVVGSKEDAHEIKQDLTSFLEDKLKLELSQEKTLITNARNKAKFLGYELYIPNDSQLKTTITKGKKRTVSGKVLLTMPRESWVNKLLELKAIKIKPDGTWKILHRPYLLNCDELEIIKTYNAEIRGFYNYYKLAYNVSKLWQFRQAMKRSMVKTFSNKFKCSTKETLEKYTKEKAYFSVGYETKKGKKTLGFFHESLKKSKIPDKNSGIDFKPKTVMYYLNRTNLIDRLLANQCEWCAESDDNCEVHHVRKLKNLKGKKFWEKLMIARQRKTMVLCKTCHVDLHAGRLSKNNLKSVFRKLVS